MLGLCSLPAETAPAIKEAGPLCREGRSPQGLGPIPLPHRRGKVSKTLGGTGVGVGATGEVKPRERSHSLHDSRASGCHGEPETQMMEGGAQPEKLIYRLNKEMACF